MYDGPNGIHRFSSSWVQVWQKDFSIPAWGTAQHWVLLPTGSEDPRREPQIGT